MLFDTKSPHDLQSQTINEHSKIFLFCTSKDKTTTVTERSPKSDRRMSAMRCYKGASIVPIKTSIQEFKMQIDGRFICSK